MKDDGWKMILVTESRVPKIFVAGLVIDLEAHHHAYLLCI